MPRRRRAVPRRNIYWRDAKNRQAIIEDRGSVWIARLPGRRSAVVYWTGNEAALAQAWLRQATSVLRRRRLSRRGRYTRKRCA